MGPQLVRCGMRSIRVFRPMPPISFNGAATCSLRNVPCASTISSRDTDLQWGRNLFVAECPRAAYQASCSYSAFNGAATCSLRNAGTPVHATAAHPAFNGAATCSLRNVREHHQHRGAGRKPSMGPQLVRCGMMSTITIWPMSMRPSMGPQLVRCGMRGAVGGDAVRPQSFNGAATCSLRNVCVPMESIIATLILQWGRNLFVAECRQSRARLP